MVKPESYREYGHPIQRELGKGNVKRFSPLSTPKTAGNAQKKGPAAATAAASQQVVKIGEKKKHRSRLLHHNAPKKKLQSK